jgi:hypothetical protein
VEPPSIGRRAEPLSIGRRAEPPSVGQRGEAPERGSKGRSPQAQVEKFFLGQSACLLETKDEVSLLKGPSAYPSAMVIAEALLVNCRAFEGSKESLL